MMDADVQKQLREKFDTAQIGLKPKITCKACSDSRSKACDNHKKTTCTSLRGGPGCGQWITPSHMHIEFVGHANVTDRLLSIDPAWTWEPVAFGPDGLPALTKDGGLWIRLTVAGVTRIGYGGADGKTGDDAVKEAVSDAIKVTAMRFGVALDLWRKEEASGKTPEGDGGSETGGNVPSNGRQQTRSGAQNGHQPATEARTLSAPDRARADLLVACEKNGWDRSAVAAEFAKRYDGADLRTEESAPRITAFTKLLPDVFGAPAANGAAQ